MRILEICPFSAGACGVWQRVKQESEEFTKLGHEVIVFSSNLEKGTGKVVPSEETMGRIKIKRFKGKYSSLTKNVTYFDFEKEIYKFNPDLIITHLLHPHSFKALAYSKKIKIPIYLVTHAPFNVKRNFILSILTKAYSTIKVKNRLKKFDKIIAITKWEVPYLLKLGVKREKIIYIPNGIPEEFFKQKILPFKKKKIMFFGRVAPIKNIELLLSSFNSLSKNNKNLVLEIVGPIEKGYEQLKKFSNSRITFTQPIYGINEKIKKIQEADIFVLPSKREAMPQSLIEAMALGKIVVSSDTDGGKEIIKNNENGLLFKINKESELTGQIKKILEMPEKEIKKLQTNARNHSKRFSWKTLIKDYEKLNNSQIKND